MQVTRALLFGATIIIGLVMVGDAQEKVTLTTPVQTALGATDFRVWQLTLQRTHPDAPAAIVVVFREVTGTTFVSRGRVIECRFDGDPADALIVTLNKINLSTTSLEKRVTQQCQMTGAIGAGTITGTPQ